MQMPAADPKILLHRATSSQKLHRVPLSRGSQYLKLTFCLAGQKGIGR